jgi:hypothetical protein
VLAALADWVAIVRTRKLDGNIPYGWRLSRTERDERGKLLDPTLVVDRYEQANVLAIRDLREAGLSFRQIALHLNAGGRITRSGGPWKFQYVARIAGREERR